MNSEVAGVLVSSETQVQLQIKLNPDYFPDYPFVIWISKIQFRSHWEDTIAATGNLHCVTLNIYGIYWYVKFNEQPKQNVNWMYIGPVFPGNLALS